MPSQLISANHAAAQAAILAGHANRVGRGFGGGVYPITPQTECIERLCAHEFDKGAVVRVESEHSAMGVCMGFATAGLRSFTASSSNGLAYMAENVFAAAFARLPIVMMAVNRTLGPPWNIWVDHGDTLMLRDAGWIQIYCENNQEVLDTILLSYRLAEDRRILLPVMVCQDAFVLSHTSMLTEIPEQAEVDAFLPALDLPHRLTDVPVTVGGLDFPHETEVHRHQHHDAMMAAPKVHDECADLFEAQFGRRPADRVVPYRMEDAEVALVAMGTTTATVRTVVDAARERGVRAGGLGLRMFRPFPEDLLRHHLAKVERVAVIDRNVCPGLGGIVWAELRGAVQGPVVQGYVMGVGGGDIRPEHVNRVLEDILARQSSGAPEFVEVC